MRARLIRDYRMAHDGVTITLYRAGEMVEGDVAEAALHDGAAVKAPDRGRPRAPDATKPAAPKETK